MIRLRKIIDTIIAAPLVGIITGILLSGSLIVMMNIHGCIRNMDGKVVEEKRYDARGYEAIEPLAHAMDEAKAQGWTFQISINQHSSEGMLIATMMINGTSVCTSHAFNADPMNRQTGPKGYPISTVGIRGK